MKMIFVFIASMISNVSLAASTHKCDSLDSIGNLVGDTKSFDNVKIAYVTTEEPAAAPDHILVFLYGPQMSQSCTAISRDKEGNGFANVKMKSLKSVSYDPKKGRLLQVEVKVPSADGSSAKTETIKFRTNTSIGTVAIE